MFRVTLPTMPAPYRSTATLWSIFRRHTQSQSRSKFTRKSRISLIGRILRRIRAMPRRLSGHRSRYLEASAYRLNNAQPRTGRVYSAHYRVALFQMLFCPSVAVQKTRNPEAVATTLGLVAPLFARSARGADQVLPWLSETAAIMTGW